MAAAMCPRCYREVDLPGRSAAASECPGCGHRLDAGSTPAFELDLEPAEPPRAPEVAAGVAVPHGGGMTELEVAADAGAGLELDWGDRGPPDVRAAARRAAEPEPLPGVPVAPSARASSRPYAPATSAAAAWTPTLREDPLVPAGMGARVVAHLVDSVAVGALTVGMWWLWLRSALRRFGGGAAARMTEAQANDFVVSLVGVMCVVAALGFLYYVLPTTVWGWSPGKRLMGLRVVTESGEPPSLWRVALREVLGKWISSFFCNFGFLMAFWDPQHRALHDRISGTCVVQA